MTREFRFSQLRCIGPTDKKVGLGIPGEYLITHPRKIEERTVVACPHVATVTRGDRGQEIYKTKDGVFERITYFDLRRDGRYSGPIPQMEYRAKRSPIAFLLKKITPKQKPNGFPMETPLFDPSRTRRIKKSFHGGNSNKGTGKGARRRKDGKRTI